MHLLFDMKKESRKNTATLKQITLYIAFCGFISPSSAFFLKNCTISTPLKNTQLKVLCYKMGFFRIPRVPGNTRILDISFNAFAQIQIGDFRHLSNLQDLNISNNKISQIQEGALDNLSNLTHLNLARNSLNTVSSGMLRGLSSLLVLRLDDNNIKDIEESAFSTLQNLKVLNLTQNHLHYIDRVKPVLAPPCLEELYIGSNNFTVFNSYEIATKPLSLKRLDLSNNPLATFQLTDNIFPSLAHLDLSYCGQNGTMTWNVTENTFLSSVQTLYFMGVHMSPQSVADVLPSFRNSLNKIRLNGNVELNKTKLLLNACSPALRVVRLNANKIKHLADHMFDPCSNLTELDLGENEISTLSQSVFRSFTQLKKLLLQINKLTRITNSFQALSTLEFLDLSRNSIRELTCDDFANLTKVKTLYLYGNKISLINSCLFKDLTSLEVLKLGTNNLLRIGDAFSNGPRSLKDLQVNFNKLSKIKKHTFRNVPQLTSLSLQDNQISEIEAHAFEELKNLTSLLLSSNKITAKTLTRHLNVFSGMPNLQNLELYANTISFKDNKLTHPPFEELKQLRVLTLNSQRRGIGVIPSNLLQGLSSLEMFYAGNTNLGHLNPDTFKFSPRLWFLDLSKNALSEDDSIPAETFHPISGLTKLILSRTQLRSLNFLLNANLSRLSTLSAPGNEIDTINETLIESLPRLEVLDLQRNTFTCDCHNEFFIEWAVKSNSTQVFYFNKYMCSYPRALRGMSLSAFNTESCTLKIDFICFLCSSIAVVLTLFCSFVWQFLRYQVIYAYYLLLAFLYDTKKKRSGTTFQYDAFISYNTQDEPWVMEELIPKLEGEQGWRLCLHHRDFEPGRPIIDNIVDGIYSSRKTICLVTRNYLKSNWCSSEVQVASFRLFDEQKDVLVLVFLEDIPAHELSPYHRMRKLVKKQTYLRWPKPGEDTKIFWQKLKMALKTKEGHKSETGIL
ncbi:toll-like receptor 22 [Pimephales promelas]|uniref:toll-like receptor 22 n=1 Tax=Pimephales promelas TaxID=90988 RepID=UPI001955DD8F|nr:toll-like receptor 22 [Pimephales promelas]XP_039544317.1 toll-like receptor 22 [Pimephales promelas]